MFEAFVPDTYSYEAFLSTILILSSLFSFAIAFPIIKLLYRFNITRRGEVDFSNLISARTKKVGTPIMGGLIVVISVILINLLFNDFSKTRVILLIFGISALLGAFDDVLNIYGKPRKVKRIHRVLKLIKVHKSFLERLKLVILLPWLIYKRIFFMLGSNPGKGIQAHEKVVVQAITGIMLSGWVILSSQTVMGFVTRFPELTTSSVNTFVWLPVFGYLNIGLLMIPFIIFTVIAMANAVNLSDGMDGLAAGLLLFSLLGFLIISLHQGNGPISILILTIIGSLISYLYFNAPPARFQMGDVGSLSLGTILAAIAFSLNVPILLLIIGFPFVAEVGSSLIQGISRRVLGRRVFAMAPLHHHFEMRGWNEEKVVIRFWLFGMFCSVIGVWIYFLTFNT